MMMTMTGVVEFASAAGGETYEDEDEDDMVETRTQKTQELTVSPLLVGEKRLNSTGKEPHKKVSYLTQGEILTQEELSRSTF